MDLNDGTVINVAVATFSMFSVLGLSGGRDAQKMMDTSLYCVIYGGATAGIFYGIV